MLLLGKVSQPSLASPRVSPLSSVSPRSFFLPLGQVHELQNRLLLELPRVPFREGARGLVERNAVLWGFLVRSHF